MAAMQHRLRGELLKRYLDQGSGGVRDHIDEVCPGCVADLIVGYVVTDSDRLIEAEFGSL